MLSEAPELVDVMAMGLHSRAKGHWEKRVHDRLRQVYERHAAMAADAALWRLRMLGRLQAQHLSWSVATTHLSAWASTLHEVDPHWKVAGCMGESQLVTWEADVAGFFFGVRLGLPREQACALVAEAVQEELRNRAAGIDALVVRGRG